MVRHVATRKRTPGWKCLLAIAIAGGGLLWHVLACVESPMAFSPSGKELAFVTMEPYDAEGAGIAGAHCYRLMVLGDFERLKVVEQTNSCMLSGPGFSPDGKRICYLRIPLLERPDAKRMEQEIKKRGESLEKLDSEKGVRWPAPPSAQPSTAPAVSTNDRALPSMSSMYQFVSGAIVQSPAPVQLLVRDAASFKLISCITVPLALLSPGGDDFASDYMMGYTTIRPGYGADGEWVYFCAGRMAMGVNLVSGEQRILAAPVSVAVLSPDRRTLAVVLEEAVGFVTIDGSMATYRSWKTEQENFCALGWKDHKTLAVLVKSEDDDREGYVIRFLRRDGGDAGSLDLELPGPPDGPLQLALGLDGKHMVVCYGNDAAFLDAEGRVLKHWHDEDDLLVHPVFTPDSQHVAMKYMAREGDGYPRVSSVVLFTPEGEEVARVAIPKIQPSATRPATRPATHPSE